MLAIVIYVAQLQNFVCMYIICNVSAYTCCVVLIRITALDLAFSSMYRDTVPVTVDRICPTVAAATMLQLVCATCICSYACMCVK